MFRFFRSLLILMGVITAVITPILTQPTFAEDHGIHITVDNLDTPNATHPLHTPLIIRFSEPVYPPDNNTPPLTITPTNLISGTTNWSDNNTTLTFVPDTHFPPDKFISAIIDTQLTGTDGTALNKHHFTFRTATPIKATIKTNSDITNVQPGFTISFNEPMDKLSVNRALTLDPPLEYTTSWTENNLTIQLLQHLQPSQRLTIKLSTDAQTINKTRILSPINHVHKAPPLLQPITFKKETDKTRIVLNFNYPVNTAAVENALQLEPYHQFDITWLTDKLAILTVNGALALHQQYTLNFTSKITPLNMPTYQPESSTFSTPSPTLTTPDSIFDPLIIHFPYAMNPQNNFPDITISPELDYSLAWNEDNTQLSILPTNHLAPQEKYTVNLHGNLYNADNQPALFTSWQKIFLSNSLPNFGHFGYGIHIQPINSNYDRIIPAFLNETDSTRITFSLYQADFDAIFNQYMATDPYAEELPYVDTKNLPLITQWQYNNFINGELNPELPQIPANVRPGAYLLEMGIGSTETDKQLLVLLTPHGLTVQKHNGSYTVWAAERDQETNPAPFELKFYNQQRQLIHQATTDEYGLYTYNPPPTSPAPQLITAERGGHLTISSLNQNWNITNYQTFTPQSATDEPVYALHTIIDKPNYLAGDTLNFKLIARQLTNSQPHNISANTPVTIQLLNPDDEIIRTKTTYLNDYGAATDSIILPAYLTHGTYNLRALFQDQKQAHFFTISPSPTPYTIDITPSQPYYIEGDEMAIDIDIYHTQTGEPLAKQDFDIDIRDLTDKPNYASLIAKYHSRYDRHFYGHGSTGYHYTLDDQGHYTYNDSAKMSYNISRDPITNQISNDLLVVVTTEDEDGNTISASQHLHIYQNQGYLTVNTHGLIHNASQPRAIDLSLTDNAHQPLANHSLELTLSSRNSQDVEKIVTLYGTTNHNGQLSIT
ncbi:MAG TPA: MG2 domain-containing protein, partial [Anaerolineae bacterium]|nr:MG2 domain-containing protein [Anaerolineae bacterium]